MLKDEVSQEVPEQNSTKPISVSSEKDIIKLATDSIE